MDRTIPGIPHLQVNNIFCIGRNYALHAKEMKSRIPEEPMVFLKPNSSIVHSGGSVILPHRAGTVHHEVELVIAIGLEGKEIKHEQAGAHIAGIAAGIDFTARDLQAKAKQSGQPWTLSKGFDTFAAISSFLSPVDPATLGHIQLRLDKNNQPVQQGDTGDMIYSADILIQYLSSCFTLQPGDLIFTGTPAGVGPVQTGDTLDATIQTPDGKQLQLTLDVE
jgi:2-keto-4-pentenoate hydratase/2-oxohepta-3-ene-1,7-dioic acid hydratase in catechol pathway